MLLLLILRPRESVERRGGEEEEEGGERASGRKEYYRTHLLPETVVLQLRLRGAFFAKLVVEKTYLRLCSRSHSCFSSRSEINRIRGEVNTTESEDFFA